MEWATCEREERKKQQLEDKWGAIKVRKKEENKFHLKCTHCTQQVLSVMGIRLSK